jgi:hypothetical protein
VAIRGVDNATFTTYAACTNVGTTVSCTVAISVLVAAPYSLTAGTAGTSVYA